MRAKYLAVLLAGAVMSGCGGGGGDGGKPGPVDPVVKPKFGAQISFGDSLSDVGTYAVGAVKTMGGGKFTINGDNTALNAALTGQNWIEVMATKFGLPAPCAAQTGLDGSNNMGFMVPVVNHPGCFAYAQGGARVTNPVGPNNKLTGSALGALTVPVVQQVSNHLAAVGGKFAANDMVLVMAGGNDMLFQLAALSAGATAAGTVAGAKAYDSHLAGLLTAGADDPVAAQAIVAAAMAAERKRQGHTDASVTAAGVQAAALQPGNGAVASPAVYSPLVQQASNAAANDGAKAGQEYYSLNANALVDAMAVAGSELAVLVKDRILGNGAQYVTVNNLPDVASTPSGLKQDAQTQALMTAMAKAFNGELDKALSAQPQVVLVDVYSLSQETAAHPAEHGLTNVQDTACDLSPAKNPLGSSLVCNGDNLKAGDVSHYAYADDVHPTPYYYSLLALKVMDKLVAKGWL